MKKAIIMGVGADQVLGAQLAKRFASEGLHVLSLAELNPDLTL